MMKNIDSQDFPMQRLPQGCKHLYGNLFMVPFSAIKTPDAKESSEGSYKFKNPRMLVERGQADLLDKKLCKDLRDSIKHRTLLNPLVCRWVEDGEKLVPMILGGDRRYRSLDYLIRKKEEVTDPRGVSVENGTWTYQKITADQAYEYVLCQVFAVSDDLEALALSWAENKTRINLTDGHEIAEVIKLREANATDGQILDILQQDQKWLAETDRLIDGLDSNSLADLLEGRIDRGSAEELVKIEDVEMRNQVRTMATEAAAETCERKIERIKKKMDKSMEALELAEGSVAFASSEEDLNDANNDLSLAKADVRKLTDKAKEVRPVATAKHIRSAAEQMGGSTPRKRAKTESASKLKGLSIKKGVEYINGLIRNNGSCHSGTFKAHIDALRLVNKLLTENVLTGNDDWESTLRNHYGK